MRDSIVFYRSYYEVIKELPDEQKLKVYEAIFEYGLNDNEVELDGLIRAIFNLTKPNIDSANARYEASVENGKKGGRPKKENLEKPSHNLDKTQTKPRQNLNDNVNDNDNVNVNDNVVVATPSAITFYLNNINSAPVAKEMEILESYQKDLPDDVLIYGMEKAVEKKARNLSYIKAIWNSWISKGITTLAEAQEETKPNVTDLQKYRSDEEIDYEQYYANLWGGNLW